MMASECKVAEKKATCRRRSRAVALAPLGSFSKILRQVATCVESKRWVWCTLSSRYHEDGVEVGAGRDVVRLDEAIRFI